MTRSKNKKSRAATAGAGEPSPHWFLAALTARPVLVLMLLSFVLGTLWTLHTHPVPFSDYLDYYVHSHYRFGLATPLADYYQNYLDQEGGRELAELLGLNAMAADNISELRFNDVEDYLFSDTIREIAPAAEADEKLFVNRAVCQSFTMDVLQDTRDYP